MTKPSSSEPAALTPSLTDVAKISDKNLLARYTTEPLLIVERAAYRAEIVSRMSAFGLDPKTCEALVDGYAAVVLEGNIADSVSFEREILRRMNPAQPPPQPANPLPPPQPQRLPPPAQPSKPLPTAPGNLRLFFLMVAEHHEQVAREAEQFAVLCRRMSESFAPSETKP